MKSQEHSGDVDDEDLTFFRHSEQREKVYKLILFCKWGVLMQTGGSITGKSTIRKVNKRF